MNSRESNNPAPFEGFSSHEVQLDNTQHRGMESDATLEEVLAHDQAERDVVYAEYNGYPVETPSSEIGRDIATGRTTRPE